MAANSTHPEYDNMAPLWARVRDFLAGEQAVKKKGAEYLPRLAEQSDDDYEGYKQRAVFLNATSRTHTALAGMVFTKDPAMTLTKPLDVIQEDMDMRGNGIYSIARQIVSEVLAVGRNGTLVEWSNEEARPYLVQYGTEEIINWRIIRIGSRMHLGMVVLKEMTHEAGDDPFEPKEVHRIRVLRLDPMPNKTFGYVAEIWVPEQRKGKDGRNEVEWMMESSTMPSRNGVVLPEIPFIFHGPTLRAMCSMCLDNPPLEDLVSLNITHYRLSADHHHGLHFVALPTPWVAGFPTDTSLRIGAGTAWVSDNPEASAGYLEFSGAGLGAIRNELDKVENSMAVMGARLLEQQKRAAETAEAMSIRQSGENAVLTGLAAAVSVSLTQALRWACWWATPAALDRTAPDVEKTVLELNTDYETGRMASGDLQALMAAYIQGGISRETLFHNLQQGEIIPPDRTFEEEMDMIEAAPPLTSKMELDDEDDPNPKPKDQSKDDEKPGDENE